MGINMVTTEQLVQIAKDSGLEMLEQSSFYKITSGGRSVYIAKSKRTPRVDISGFNFRHPGVHSFDKDETAGKRMGRVRARVDFTKEDDVALEAFQTAIALLEHLTEHPEAIAGGDIVKDVDALLGHGGGKRRTGARNRPRA